MTPPDSSLSENNMALAERLTVALQAAGIGTWEMDSSNNQVRWDDRTRELYGFSGGEVVDYEQVLLCVYADDRQIVRAAVAKALNPQSDGVYDVQLRTIGADKGSGRWISCKGKAFVNEAGNVYRFCGTAQECTPAMPDLERLAFSETIAQVALENSNSGYFRISLTSDEMDYSPGYARILTGNEDSDLKRDGFVNHLHPDDLAVRNNAFEVAAKTGQLEYEARTIWNDGSIHWLRSRGAYLTDAAGKPYALTGTLYDTTAEHLHQDAVHEAEDLLAAAFNNASMGMAFLDLTGAYLNINAAYTQLLGYQKEELQSTNYLALTHPDDQVRNTALFKELVSGKRQYFNLTKRYIHKDGGIRWAQVTVTLLTRSTDKEGRILTTLHDINSEVEGQRALAVSEALFKNVTNSAPTGLWLSDQAGGLIYLNRTLIEWTGMPYESLLGTGWANAIIEEDRQRSAEAFLVAIAARDHYDVLFRIRTGDSRIIWCRAAGDPYYGADGRYEGYAGFCMDIDELVGTSGELNASEARLRSIVEEAPVATCLLVGRQLTIEVANELMLTYWGKDHSVLGKPLLNAVPELKGQPFLAILDDVFTTGKPYQAKAMPTEVDVNGVVSTSYFNVSYQPLFDATGAVYAILDVAIDVTEEVIARQNLEESELFSRNVFYNSPVAKVVFVGQEMIIRTINENMLTMLGRDSSIVGMPFMEAVPELLPTPLMNQLRHVLSTGETFYQPEEKIDLIKQGQPYTGYYNYIYKALRNTAGAIYGVMVTATEVTKQVKIRQQIEETEEVLRGTIELADLATWSVDAQTYIYTFSDRLQIWFGFEGEETVYTTGYNPILAEDRDRLRQAVATALTPESGGIYDIEYTLVEYRTGRKRICHAQGKTLFDAAGKPIRLNGAIQDITQQRQLQLALEQQVQERTEELEATNEELAATNEEMAATNEELTVTYEEIAIANKGLEDANLHLSRSNQNLEQFAYIASHDLQEPLRKIQQFGDLLKIRYAGTLGEELDYLNRMQSAASRMSLLIKDLLSFSRISISQAPAVPVSLTDVVDQARDNLAVAIAETNADIQVGVLPTVEGDALQLGQLFQNLLSNALKFRRTDQSGALIIPRVQVRAYQMRAIDLPSFVKPPRQSAVYFRIDVSDNGIGFDEKYIDRIFQVFQRLHGKNEFAGTGIGLAICQKVVSNHGGVITATSQPGQGATFSIYLPA